MIQGYDPIANSIDGGGVWHNGKVVVWLAVAVLPFLTLGAHAQTVSSTPPAPLTPDQSAKLNRRVAAAETAGQPLDDQIVSETFTGTIVSVPDSHSVSIRRGDEHADETVALYGTRAFSSAPGAGKDAISYMTSHLKGVRVKVEGRRRQKDGNLSALITVIAPMSAARVNQQIDGSGAGRDFPQSSVVPTVPSTPTTVNFSLLRLGLVRFDNRQLKDAPDLASAEASARKEKKGYWADAVAAATPAP